MIFAPVIQVLATVSRISDSTALTLQTKSSTINTIIVTAKNAADALSSFSVHFFGNALVKNTPSMLNTGMIISSATDADVPKWKFCVIKVGSQVWMPSRSIPCVIAGIVASTMPESSSKRSMFSFFCVCFGCNSITSISSLVSICFSNQLMRIIQLMPVIIIMPPASKNTPRQFQAVSNTVAST